MNLTSFSIHVFSAPESRQRCHIASSCHVSFLYCSVTVVQPFFFMILTVLKSSRKSLNLDMSLSLFFFPPINALGYEF